jgi:hypothetical protein
MLHARPKNLNPAETAAFREDMVKLPPDHAADVALKYREAFVNAASRRQNPATDGIGVLLSTGYAGVIGAYDGELEAQRNEVIRRWVTNDAAKKGIDPLQYPTPFVSIYDKDGKVLHEATPDPRKWFGVPKVFYPTAVFGVMAAAGVGAAAPGEPGVDFNSYLVGVTIAGAAYTIGSSLREVVAQRRTEAILREARLVEAANTSSATTPASATTTNPGSRRSYIRVV